MATYFQRSCPKCDGYLGAGIVVADNWRRPCRRFRRPSALQQSSPFWCGGNSQVRTLYYAKGFCDQFVRAKVVLLHVGFAVGVMFERCLPLITSRWSAEIC